MKNFWSFPFSGPGREGHKDFVCIEIFDGIPYFVYNHGGEKYHIPMSQTRVDDGRPHIVYFSISKIGSMTAKFDGRSIPLSGNSTTSSSFKNRNHGSSSWSPLSLPPLFFSPKEWRSRIRNSSALTPISARWIPSVRRTREHPGRCGHGRALLAASTTSNSMTGKALRTRESKTRLLCSPFPLLPSLSPSFLLILFWCLLSLFSL